MSETIQQKRPTLSYEIFPPNTQVGDEKIITVLDELKSLKPEFISVPAVINNAILKKQLSSCPTMYKIHCTSLRKPICRLFIYPKSKCAPLLIN